MTQRTKIIIIVAALLVFALALGGMFAAHLVAKAEEDSRLAAIQAKVDPLIAERLRLEAENKQIEIDFLDSLSTGATLTIIIDTLDTPLYDVIFPMMQGDGGEDVLVGTLALSSGELPGKTGKITVEQFDEMRLAGWSVAIEVAKEYSERELESYLDSMENELAALNIDMPRTAYFGEGAYHDSLDSVLLSRGIDCVVHNGDSGYPFIGNDIESGMWRIGAMGWSGIAGSGKVGESAKITLAALEEERGGTAFVISLWYGEITERPSDTAFNPAVQDSNLMSMMQSLREDRYAEKYEVADVALGELYYRAYVGELEDRMPELEAMLLPNRTRIAELRREIDKIYKEG